MHISRWQLLRQYKSNRGIPVGISYWPAWMLYTAVMIKASYFILLLAIVLPAPCLADSEVRNRLLGMEWALVATEWQSLPPESIEVLSKIALSHDEMTFLRGRALEVLSVLPGELADETFRRLIEQREDSVLRRRAVDCLCQSETSLPVEEMLLPLLAEDDKQLSVRVAACLVKLGVDSEPAKLALQNYIQNAESWELRAAGVKRATQ